MQDKLEEILKSKEKELFSKVSHKHEKIKYSDSIEIVTKIQLESVSVINNVSTKNTTDQRYIEDIERQNVNNLMNFMYDDLIRYVRELEHRLYYHEVIKDN